MENLDNLNFSRLNDLTIQEVKAQFITREPAHKGVLERLAILLNAYFSI